MKINIRVNHQLSQQDATQRLKNRLSHSLQNEGKEIIPVQEEWQEHVGRFSLSAKGMDVSGTLDVQPDHVDIELTLPIAAFLIKKQIEESVQLRTAQLLA